MNIELTDCEVKVLYYVLDSARREYEQKIQEVYDLQDLLISMQRKHGDADEQ